MNSETRKPFQIPTPESDSIDHRGILSNRSQHAKLTANARPHELLVAHGTVVDPRRNLDIPTVTLSVLVVLPEAPRVSLAIGGHSNAGVGSRRNLNAVEVGNDERLDQVSRLPSLLVEEEMILGHIINLHTALTIVDATPNQDLTSCGASNGVMSTTGNLLDVVVVEDRDLGGIGDGAAIVLLLVFWHTRLAEGVESPRVDITLVVNGERVVVATANVNDILLAETKLTGDQSAFGGAGDHAASELALLSCAPRKDLALLVQSEDVVGAGSQSGDVLEFWDEDGSVCGLDLGREAEDTVIALGVLVVSWDAWEEDLRGRYPSRRPDRYW